jgi:hypothetical protein
MKRIHPTRKERAARGRYSYTVKQLRDPLGRVYSGRPTRKQRRKMRHLRKMSERPAVCVVDGVLAWARNVKGGETFTITHEQLMMAARP